MEDISQEWEGRIELFLENKLSDQERTDFLAEIKENDIALKLLDEAILEKQLLEGLIRDDLKKQLNLMPEKAMKSYKYLPFIRVLILVLILLSTIWFISKQTPKDSQQESIEPLLELQEDQIKDRQNTPKAQPDNPEVKVPSKNGKQIAKEAYKKPEVFAMILRGDKTQSIESGSYEEAVSLFRKNKYKESLERIVKIGEKQTIEGELLYLKGHVHFNLGQYELAEDDFSALNNNNYSPFQDDAKWYLMLSLLSLEKYQLATKVKQELIGDITSEYQEEARNINW